MRDEVGDAGEDVPEPCLGEAALAQRGIAIEKLRADLIAVVNRVVEALLQVFFAQRFVGVDQVEQILRRVFRHGWCFVAGLRAGDIEDVEDQHRVVGNHRAAGLRYKAGVGDGGLVANLRNHLDDVGAVLGDRVIAG